MLADRALWIAIGEDLMGRNAGGEQGMSSGETALSIGVDRLVLGWILLGEFGIEDVVSVGELGMLGIEDAHACAGFFY